VALTSRVYRFLTGNAGAIAKVALIPFLIVLAVSFVGARLERGTYVGYTLNLFVVMPAMAVFAVPLYRKYLLYLLDVAPSLRLGRRELGFYVRQILILLPFDVFGLLSAMLIFAARNRADKMQGEIESLILLIVIAFTIILFLLILVWLFLRLSLILPARVIDHKGTFSHHVGISWRKMKGQVRSAMLAYIVYGW